MTTGAHPTDDEPAPYPRPGSVIEIARRATGSAGLRVLGRVPPPRRPWVFAVEDTTVQITWAALGPGPVRFRAADTTVEVMTDGGPGSVVLGDLPVDTNLTVHLDGEGLVLPAAPGDRDLRPLPRAWRRLAARTLRPPPGEELFRFATVSDLHIGASSFGFRQRMVEVPAPAVAHPVRAARTALDELTAWGAGLLVVKGDLTDRCRPAQWATVGRLLRDLPMPVELMPGNHDYYGSQRDPGPHEAMRALGYEQTAGVHHRDVPGLRLVLVDSTVAPHGDGRIRQHHDAAIRAASSTAAPVFVAMHHYAQRLPFPTFWPPGIPSPQANRFLGALAAVKPAAMISSGHTHRHRRRHIGPLVWTEVGSPKDFPGTWAGYVVHEGGIRQVVRRVARPDLLRWTDYTAAAALGVWGLWAPGRLSHRCFTHPWPGSAARS